MEAVLVKSTSDENMMEWLEFWAHKLGLCLVLLLIFDWVLCTCGIKS